MAEQLSVRELKRHASHLGVKVVWGSSKSELAEQISKKAKTDGGGIFFVEPSSLSFDAVTEISQSSKVFESTPSAIHIGEDEVNAWQPFFQGKSLFVQDDNGIIEVDLDDDGCCTIEDFATSVCGLKIGEPGSHHTCVECVTIDSHEGGKRVTVYWGS